MQVGELLAQQEEELQQEEGRPCSGILQFERNPGLLVCQVVMQAGRLGLSYIGQEWRCICTWFLLSVFTVVLQINETVAGWQTKDSETTPYRTQKKRKTNE